MITEPTVMFTSNVTLFQDALTIKLVLLEFPGAVRTMAVKEYQNEAEYNAALVIIDSPLEEARNGHYRSGTTAQEILDNVSEQACQQAKA